MLNNAFSIFLEKVSLTLLCDYSAFISHLCCESCRPSISKAKTSGIKAISTNNKKIKKLYRYMMQAVHKTDFSSHGWRREKKKVMCILFC